MTVKCGVPPRDARARRVHALFSKRASRGPGAPGAPGGQPQRGLFCVLERFGAGYADASTGRLSARVAQRPKKIGRNTRAAMQGC